MEMREIKLMDRFRKLKVGGYKINEIHVWLDSVQVDFIPYKKKKKPSPSTECFHPLGERDIDGQCNVCGKFIERGGKGK